MTPRRAGIVAVETPYLTLKPHGDRALRAEGDRDEARAEGEDALENLRKLEARIDPRCVVVAQLHDVG